MRNSGFLWALMAMMLLMDLYIFQVVKSLMQHASPRLKLVITILYWLVAVAALVTLISFPAFNGPNVPRAVRTYVLAMLVGLFFAKLVATLVFGVDDLRRGITWLVTRSRGDVATTSAGEGISRSAFLSWMGIGLGGGLLGTLMYGFSNKYNYQVVRKQLRFDKLPAAFKGLRIVHISDIHAGSFTNKLAVEKGIERIMREQPDLIFFTGDLVNDKATEMDDYMDVFSRLKAPMGVYSTLGNHDYGDYIAWESLSVKSKNLERLKEIHAELGWKLLMNEHVPLERNGQQIAVIGIENWSSKGNFPKYGRLDVAHKGTEQIPFKILLSHDPSHWSAEVQQKYNDIDLMLAGHTHGMQFGVEVPGFRWSPVQYMYQHWAGLYENEQQKLYVNRGFGFIGYPGRVGILPEITVLELA
ncbi:MAG: metallophosphoesterase [Chitinophagaceae bacterium]|nr:MAG: metallophosphoesterase [Chitinophagaceae bacterium]